MIIFSSFEYIHIDLKWLCFAKFIFRDIVFSVSRKTSNEPQHDKTNKMTCVPCEDSDQSGPLKHREDWSDWVDRQADQSIRWFLIFLVLSCYG